MVYDQVSTELLNPLARERKDVIESDLESVVVILGEESKCLIPLISNFDPLLRDFDKVLTDLARTEVACNEFREKYEQGEVHIKTLRQQKKSIDLRTVELEALHQAEQRWWNEEKKQMERRIEDYEWKLENRETDLHRINKVNTDLQKQLNTSSNQIQKIKTAKNITRKFSSAVRMVQHQKDTDATQKIIRKLEEDSEQYTDRFNTLDNENSALSRQLEEAQDMIEELESREEMNNSEKRVWKVEREDLLEESAHLGSQLKLLEAELAKHHVATKSLQAQIRAVEAEIKTHEAESQRISDENQLLESQMTRMKNIMINEGISLDEYPELSIKLPDGNKTTDTNTKAEAGLSTVLTSTPLKNSLKSCDSVSIHHELSLQDELDLEGSVGSGEKKQSTSDLEDLEIKNTQLEQELMRTETEKNVLLLDVHRAEKTASGKDREISGMKEEMKVLSTKIMEQRSQLEAYEEQRGMMEDEHLKMAEKIVRDTRSRRSFRKTNTSTTDVGEDIMNDSLFDENMQLMKEKQELFKKYTQLEAKSLEVERKLKDQKTDAERKLKRLEEDYSAIMSSEHTLSEKLREVQAKHDRLKCLYNLLQSEDNEGEDPEELVSRLKYRRSEVETLLRDRTEMRTQIVSLQKMINMRNEADIIDHSEGIVGRVMSVLRRKSKNDRTVGRLGSLAARTTTGVIGKELGYSWVEKPTRKRKSLTLMFRSTTQESSNSAHSTISLTSHDSVTKMEELKELSSIPRKISNGWTYSPTGIFSTGLPPLVPVYSKLLMIDERPQRVVCSSFVPSWPFPRLSGVRISVESDMHNSTESRTSFEGRDSSNKSKESSSRGSTRSIESKDSVRSSMSMEGKSNFPLIEEAVMGSENVALGMLCMSSLKPLASMALNPHTLGDVSSQAEDRMSAALFSHDVLRNSTRRSQTSTVPQTHGEPSIAEYVNEAADDSEAGEVPADCRGDEAAADDDAEVRRVLFRQTKDAFLKRPVSSFKHKVSQGSRSLYPFLWVVTCTDDSTLSFLHVVNLNFPARVARTHFLCEGKVHAMAIVKNKADDPMDEIQAKKVLFGKQQSGDGCSCWMGTSDGRLFILELKEPFAQVYSHQLSGSVLQIVYSEPHVFVSLHNGALVVYTRDKEGVWDMENYQLIVVDITGKKVRRILEIDNKVWCGTGPSIAVCNALNYRIDEKIDVFLNDNECIREIIHIADTVWISLSKSTKLVVVATQTKRVLRVISLKGYLLRTGLRHGLDLQQSDLYITTLFYDGSLVWVGTNIGVVLAIRFPVHLEEAGENVPPQEADRVKERSTKLSSADDDLYLHNGDHMVNGHGGSQTEEKKEDSGLINGTNSDVSGSDPTVCERVQFDPKSESLHYSNNGKVGSINDTRDHLENGKLSNLSREMRKSSENGEFSSSTEAHLQKDTTFDYTDDVELGPSEVIESSKIVDKFTNSISGTSNISDETEEMLASFDLDSVAAKQVNNLSEEHILFSIYGNQGPVNCFCNVRGDEELPSLLCGSGIGFDDYEVKGLKSARRKDCIDADSADDPRLLAQLLIWSYSK